MNNSETKQILSILRAAYPHSFKDLTRADAETMIALWERQFAEEDARAVTAAVESLIATRTAGYTPTIGEVKEQMHRLRTSEELDAASAWALVSKACANGIYGYRKEFEKLPPIVQTAVGAPEQLREWAMMDAEVVQSVIASNFQKTYRITQQRQKELTMLPADIRRMINGTADRLALNE